MKIEILFLSLLFYIIILILMSLSLFWKKDFNLNFKKYFKDLIKSKNIFGIIYSIILFILIFPITIVLIIKKKGN